MSFLSFFNLFFEKMLPVFSLCSVLLFLVSCGKGGPEAPVAIQPTAELQEIPIQTALSGQIQGLVSQTQEDLFTVSLFDENGNKLADTIATIEGDFNFSAPIRPSQKQFLIRASRKGETVLTSSTEIVAGKDKGNLILNPVSHLSVIFAGGGVDQEGLKRTQQTEAFIQANASQAEIEQISQEIRNLTIEQIVSDFLNINAGGRNAINQILEKIYPSDSSSVSP